VEEQDQMEPFPKLWDYDQMIEREDAELKSEGIDEPYEN
jgi:hypothetical protein